MKNKKSIIIAAGIFATIAILLIAFGFYYSQKIKARIAENVQAYETIDVDLLQQEIKIKGLEFHQAKTSLKASEVTLNGFSYWKYIFNDRLIIDRIEVSNPQLTVVTSKEKTRDSSKASPQGVLVRNFRAVNGVFRLQKKDSAGNEVFIRFPKLELSAVKIDSTTKDESLPFKYSSYHIKSDSVAIKMNPQHFIAAEGFSIHNGKASVKNFRIIPYKEKGAFDQSIPYEKDRIALKVDSIGLDNLTFDFRRDTIFLKNPLMMISGADLDIYRNKLLPDDQRTKTLLSQKMRNSPVKFDFKKIRVENSKITYDEKVKAQQPPSTVTFNKVQGTIENFVNIQMQRKDFPRTDITADALFMNSSPLSIKWSFNAANMNDEFLISGDFGTLAGNTLDPLLKPSLGLEAEGKLKSVYFTFTGNDDVAEGDVRVVYDQFKLSVIREEGQKKNKLLSALANLFVDNDGISDQHTQHVQITRDKTKSFWNYIWMGLKKGVIDALAQF